MLCEKVVCLSGSYICPTIAASKYFSPESGEGSIGTRVQLHHFISMMAVVLSCGVASSTRKLHGGVLYELISRVHRQFFFLWRRRSYLISETLQGRLIWAALEKCLRNPALEFIVTILARTPRFIHVWSARFSRQILKNHELCVQVWLMNCFPLFRISKKNNDAENAR